MLFLKNKTYVCLTRPLVFYNLLVGGHENISANMYMLISFVDCQSQHDQRQPVGRK